MTEKHKFAEDYDSEQLERVKATCLYVATKLGDLMDDLMIIGGLVPSLIIDQTQLPQESEAHVGTLDLDVGLQVALLEQQRYRELTKRLRDAGFEMDTNESGNPTRQRWALVHEASRVTIDFLIPPSRVDDQGGRLRDIEPDFAAIIAPGLGCAFRDRKKVTLRGRTIFSEKATRDVWVCDAGGFVVLKCLAFDGRGENKDAYDLFYVIRNYGTGIEEVAGRLRPLLDDEEARKAVEILKRDFTDHESLGPRRVAEFMSRGPDVAVQADVVSFVSQLLRLISNPG